MKVVDYFLCTGVEISVFSSSSNSIPANTLRKTNKILRIQKKRERKSEISGPWITDWYNPEKNSLELDHCLLYSMLFFVPYLKSIRWAKVGGKISLYIWLFDI